MHAMQAQSFLHLKTSREFKQRKEVLSKALVRELVSGQDRSYGVVQEVWLSENGREALVKFLYKDSAKRVIATHARDKSFEDIRCVAATQETINDFFSKQTSEVNLIRKTRRDFGVPDGAQFRNGCYSGANMARLEDLEQTVRKKLGLQLN